MPIITPDIYAAATNQTFTGGDLTALATITAGVDAAIRREIRPFEPEPVTRTVYRDAPYRNVLDLGVCPIRSITSLYLKYGANGVDAEFDSASLLTVGDDYYLPIDDVAAGYNRSGLVYRRGVSIWGFEYLRNAGRLASHIDPCRGAIKAVLVCGPTSVPDDLMLAAVLATSLILNRKEVGAPFASESWNGRSQSLAGPFVATAALATPDIANILAKYQTIHVAG